MVEQWEKELESQVCLITCQLNATPKRIQELISKTNKNEKLSKLKKVIKTGWPNNKKKLHYRVREYNQYRDELTITNDLVYKG